MSAINKIVEKIKNFISRRNQKLLPEGQEKIYSNTAQYDNKEFIHSLKYNVPNNAQQNIGNKEQYALGTLDNAIEQYIQGLAYSYKNNLNRTSYQVLTNLFARENQPGGLNLQKEQALISSLKANPNKYDVIQQGKSQPVFYHIHSRNNIPTDGENIIRFYINVKRENIAELSNELVNSFGDEEFYFKFVADNQLNGKARSESLVIYEDKNRINRTLQIINNIRAKNPKIFEDSEKMANPFLKKTCNGIVSYASEVTGEYTDMIGQKRQIVPSFNSELSVALGEAYIKASYDILNKNKDARKGIPEQYLENMHQSYLTQYMNDGRQFEQKINQSLNQFIYAYPFINRKHQNELVEKVKQNLLNAKYRNPVLDINTEEKTNNNYER